MISNLRQTFRELGLAGGVIYLADRAFEQTVSRRVFYYYSIVAQPVVPPRLRNRRGQDMMVIRSPDQLDACPFELSASPEMTRQRVLRGYHCIVLHRGDELTAYAWVALDGFDEDEVRCRFIPVPADATGWDFDVYIPPNKRGTFAFVQLWDAVNSYYIQQNRLQSFSRVSRFNIQSLKSHESMGAVAVGSVLFIVVGRFQLMLARQQPFIHVSFSRAPTLRVSNN